MKKYIYLIPLIIILIIGGFWIFNHINVWLSILYYLVLIFVSVEIINKQLKKDKK